MRHVFENQAEARSKGERAAREMLAAWTWEKAAAKIIARLDQIKQGTDSNVTRTSAAGNESRTGESRPGLCN